MKDRFCLRKRSAPRGPHVITYSATLDVPADTATLLTELLVAERLRRGTGVGSRAASCSAQAVLVLRWFREDADMRVLAADTGISLATGYRYLHGHRRARRPGTGPAPGACRRCGRGLDPRDAGRHPHPHRSLPHGQPGDRS